MALAAAMVALGGARSATAQTKPIVVIWQAPPECPTAARVETEVEANLARSGAATVPVVAMVSVSGPTGGRWQASLLFQAGFTRAERRFEAESCEAIASAAALIITLWVEGGPDTPPPTAAHDSERPPIALDAASEPTPFVVMLNGLLDWGTMPDPPAGGMEASAGPTWTFTSWHLRVLGDLSFFPKRRTPLMPSGVSQGNFELFDLSGRGCATVAPVSRFEIGPCAGVELAVMHGSGTELQDGTQLWLSLLGSALASLSISPSVAVFGRADVVLPTDRRTFFDFIPYGNTIYKVSTVAVRVALGLELRF